MLSIPFVGIPMLEDGYGLREIALSIPFVGIRIHANALHLIPQFPFNSLCWDSDIVVVGPYGLVLLSIPFVGIRPNWYSV